MSISAIAGSSPYAANESTTDPRALFQQLTQSINSGDLTSAQQTFNALVSNAGSRLSSSPLGQDVTALGQAIQSGNVASAQQALATLQTDAQNNARGHHHHHHHHAGAAASQTSTTSSTNTNPLIGSTIDVSA